MPTSSRLFFLSSLKCPTSGNFMCFLQAILAFRPLKAKYCYRKSLRIMGRKDSTNGVTTLLPFVQVPTG